MSNSELRNSIALKLGVMDLRILGIKKCAEGMSADIFFVDLLYKDDLGAENRKEIVIRQQPEGGILENYDYAAEYRLQDALWKNGIPVPRVLWYEPDKTVLERPFYVMEKIDGSVQKLDPRIASKNAFDDDERIGIGNDFVKHLANIHKIDWSGTGLEFLYKIPEGEDYTLYEIESWEGVVARAGYRNHPMMSILFNIMKDYRPDPSPLCLVHGDYRTGNYMTSDGRIKAILDWELCHLGDPYEDLAYVLSPVWRSASGLVNHLMTEEEFLIKYEACSGRKIDCHRLIYFGLLNGIRSLGMLTGSAKAFETTNAVDLRDGSHSMTLDMIISLIITELEKLKEHKR